MREITAFGSYAHSDQSSADRLSAAIKTYFASDKKFRLRVWRDLSILPGEEWHETIQSALAGSEVGLLYISRGFLASDYIREYEKPGKIVIPIMLGQIDFSRMDLRGLEKLQIFGLDGKAYSQCGARREEFEFQLYQKIHDRLVKEFPDAK